MITKIVEKLNNNVDHWKRVDRLLIEKKMKRYDSPKDFLKVLALSDDITTTHWEEVLECFLKSTL